MMIRHWINQFVLGLLLPLLFSSVSWGFLEARWPANLNSQSRTYIVIAGAGYDHMGDLFTISALAKVQKIREFEPTAQVIFISAEREGERKAVSQMREWASDAALESSGTGMTALEVLSRMQEFSRIAGIFIFGHNAPSKGTGFEDADARFSAKVPGIGSLATHFTSDASAALYGCNSGFKVAPDLAKIWGIPVQGSFTSTNFQQLHSNGHFYDDDDGLYPSGSWASRNTRTYSQAWTCPDGQCLRMKPDFSPYSGIWGKYSVGLGFYKWFCPSGQYQISHTQCLQAMKRGALLWVGDSRFDQKMSMDQVQDFLFDFFCPQDKNSVHHNNCVNGITDAIRTHDMSYTSFEGSSLQCNWQGCDVSIQCGLIGCQVHQGTSGDGHDTMMQEVQSYIEAFALPDTAGAL